ncbi:MAG: hypothetical protein PVF73_04910 [Bacteroidales bacterium]|jgi:hypothetical protein
MDSVIYKSLSDTIYITDSIINDTIYYVDISPISKIDSISNLSGIIIGTCAIIVAIVSIVLTYKYNKRNLDETIKHNKASVKPLLHISVNRDNHNTFKYTLYNFGYGPALVDKLEYSFQGEVSNSMDKLINKLLPRLQTKTPLQVDFNSVEYRPMSVIPVNSSRIIVDITVKDQIYIDSFIKLLEKIEVKFFYSDLYGETYQGIFEFNVK